MTLLGAIDTILWILEQVTEKTKNKLDDTLLDLFTDARVAFGKARAHVLTKQTLAELEVTKQW